jgi:hypothetical protein
MAYFNNLPEILYNFPVAGTEKVILVRDVTANVRVIKQVLENVTLYDEYDVGDGETPEIVSQKIYGNPEFHWVIMMINERYDYVKDWVLTYETLLQYCKDKYGVDNIYQIHHYEDENGYVVNDDYPLATPIDNITYETKLNEDKRRIKLLSQTLIQTLSNEFVKLMNP